MSSVRKALSLSFASQYTIQIVGLISIIALSRLLTPEEIGVFAVASVVLFVAGEIRMFGIGQYLIREPDLTDGKIRRALGVMIIMSWGMAALLVLSASWLADFYDEQGLIEILWLVAVTFVLAPFIAVPYSVLRRNMEFHKTLGLDATRATTQGVISVAGAWYGLGYMSMAWGLVIGSVVEIVLLQFMRPAGVPALPSFRGLGSVLRFGTFTGLSGLFAKTGEGTPELVLGRVGTMTDVALFSRGLGVVMIFNRAVTLAVRPVILPHFAAEYRETRSVTYAYLRAVELQTGLAWPFFAGFAMAALPLVRVLYGDQWDASVPVAEVLVAWGVLFAMHCYCQDALLAVGEVTLAFWREVIMFVVRLAAVLVGATEGPMGVAVAFSVSGLFELLVTVIVLKRGIGLGAAAFFHACRKSVGVAVITLAGCWLSAASVESTFSSDFFRLAAFGTIGMTFWLAGIFLCRHPLADELIRALRSITRRAE